MVKLTVAKKRMLAKKAATKKRMVAKKAATKKRMVSKRAATKKRVAAKKAATKKRVAAKKAATKRRVAAKKAATKKKRGGAKGDKAVTERALRKLVKEKGVSKKIMKMIPKPVEKCDECRKPLTMTNKKTCNRCGEKVCSSCIVDSDFDGEVCEMCNEWLEERAE